jgi:hypothetical protein
VKEILTWADAYHQRTGAWPSINYGPIPEALGDTWRKVDTALRYGLRGLPGRTSLAQLLAERRGVRHHGRLPPFREKQILAWADAHRRRTGLWPTAASGPVVDAPEETWRAVDQALRVGVRGLPSGSSLARLLMQRRGVRHLQRLPRLTARQILTWADAHRRRTGTWPNSASGPVAGTPGEHWQAIDAALTSGRRGLPGGSSLARLLAEHRGLRNPKSLPHLTLQKVRLWARAYERRTGRWPTPASGSIPEAPAETWSIVQAALLGGYRGLPAGLTLARVLGRPGGGPRKAGRAPLTERRVLAWADAHHRRTGTWPHARSGPIAGKSNETWRDVDQALRTGQRGLPGRKSLAQLLAVERGRRSRVYPPLLAERQILVWARRHLRRTGAWPSARSGPVVDAPGESWRAVDEALRGGSRGLHWRSSLAGFLAHRGGARNRTNLPRLNEKEILRWAVAHRRRQGRWPAVKAGSVREALGETWRGIDLALRWGYRGLPGGLSLAQLLARRGGARNRTNLPALSDPQVLAWAKAHHRRTGDWPSGGSGPVTDAPGETWRGVDLALAQGFRGLPGGSSLSRLLSGLRQGAGQARRASG